MNSTPAINAFLTQAVANAQAGATTVYPTGQISGITPTTPTNPVTTLLFSRFHLPTASTAMAAPTS